MSEETPKTTTILKEKDPKRVEAGKRLAQLNKERKLHRERKEYINENKININYSLILKVIGVTAAVVSLYNVRKEFNSSAVKKNKTPKVETKDPEPLQVKPLTVPLLDTLE